MFQRFFFVSHKDDQFVSIHLTYRNSYLSIFSQVVQNNKQIFYTDLQNALNLLSGRITPEIKVAGTHYHEVYKSLLGP